MVLIPVISFTENPEGPAEVDLWESFKDLPAYKELMFQACLTPWVLEGRLAVCTAWAITPEIFFFSVNQP